ncbi:hydroxymethylbilane synthase [uncultured Enterovirga sp.]|uniref:hydroxymethylbilane synthase n=1 Tax=uncultured Enterovirga sp. TaxID=2026352 RepID=UPI0035C97F6F
MSDSGLLWIGTRRSPLALAQAHAVQTALGAALGRSAEELPLNAMVSTGDRILDRSLAAAGGKGLFTKELDEALLGGSIDLAVHSAKDLPTALPDGLAIVGCLAREDARDVLITSLAPDLAGLPAGTVVGSASLRRQAILLRTRPDLRVTLLRGNVGTRLAKLANGEVGATLLALAGLKRLGLEAHATSILSLDDMLPAVGQGVIAIMARIGDERVRTAIASISDRAAERALDAERAFLAVLDGSCRTPIAGHATLDDGQLQLRGLVLTPDGREAVETTLSGPVEDAHRIGHEAGAELRARLPAGWQA